MRLPLVCGAAMLLAACVTQPSSEERIELLSNAPGATATLANGTSCTTPCAVSVPRIRNDAENTLTVRFSAPGCEMSMDSSVSTYGSMPHDGTQQVFQHQPNPLRVDLRCGR